MTQHIKKLGRPAEYKLTEAERDKLNSLDMSNVQMAHEIGINYFTFWNIRNGRTGCSLEKYRLILTYLENIK